MLAGNFGSSFSAASSKMSQLKLDIQKLNAEYKKGEISADQYNTHHQKLASQLANTRQELERTKNAQEQYNKANEKMNELAQSFSGKAMGSIRNALTIGAGVATVGGGLFVGSSIKKAMDYEAQLSSIQALTGITNDELAKMDQLALDMGQKTKYSALEAAQGIEELLKAGMSPAIVQAGGLEAALNLATAGGLDLTEAAETMSDALNGFKRDGMSAAEAANILSGAANASSTDVHKLKESISAVGPVGEMLGVSFKSINGVLAAFSNNSLKGSDAGTSLKTMLMNLQPQTKQAKEMFAQYGLVSQKGANIFFKANGELKDLSDVAGILHDKFKKLNDQQRADAFFNLFGSDAVRAASILFKESSDGIQDMYKQMADVTAYDVAKKKMDNAAGSVEQLRGTIETLQIRALRPTLPFIKKLADSAGDMVERFTPAITRGVQEGVDSAKRYLKEHFIDNPEFTKLDRKGQFEFVIDDLKKTFDAWYDAGGNKQISNATSALIHYVSDALHGSSAELTGIGAELGKSLAGGMISGLKEFAANNPEFAAMLTFISTPGPVQVKAAAAIAVGAGGVSVAGSVVDAAKDVKSGVASDAKVFSEQGVWAGVKNFFNNISENFKTPDVRAADGHRLGGKELYDYMKQHPDEFPNGKQKVSLSQANNSLSASNNIVINANFAPVINGSGPDVIPALQDQQKSFTDELQAQFRRQRRLALE